MSMKNVIAAAVLSSSSALIGFATAGVMLGVNESEMSQRAYDVMKSCKSLSEFDKDQQVMHRVLMLQVLESDDEETRVMFKAAVAQTLLEDAVRLKHQIETAPSDKELQQKKDLIREIESVLPIEAS